MHKSTRAQEHQSQENISEDTRGTLELLKFEDVAIPSHMLVIGSISKCRERHTDSTDHKQNQLSNSRVVSMYAGHESTNGSK